VCLSVEISQTQVCVIKRETINVKALFQIVDITVPATIVVDDTVSVGFI